MDKTISRWFQFVVLNMAFGCFCRGQIDLEPKDVPWENEPWTLQCSVNSIVSTVTFFNPGDTTAGNCEPSGVLPATCTESIGNTLAINETTDSVSMTRTITNADTGTWKCTHSSDSKPYNLSSPLPSRIHPNTLTSYEMHSMTAKAGSELTPDTVHSFNFHYGCVSSNLKFVWTTVPGSSSSDSSNTNSNSLTCTTKSAYMSTLATTAAILQSVTAKETKLKVSVYVDGYDNLAVEEYTYNVTFSPGVVTTEESMEGAASEPSKNCGYHFGWGVLGACIGMVAGSLILYIYYKKDEKWKTFCSWKMVVCIVFVLVAGLVCYFVCKNGLVEAIIAGIALLVITLIAATIMDIVRKPQEKKRKEEIQAEEMKRREELQAEEKKRREELQAEEQKKMEELQAEEQKRREEIQSKAFPANVMLFVTTIDTKGPIMCIWKNEKDEQLSIDKTMRHSKPKLSKLSSNQMPELKDRGIYQCLRRFEKGKEDTINVVFHVSDICPTSLTVHPIFWRKTPLKDQGPSVLKEMVETIKADQEFLNKHSRETQYIVEWKFRATSLKEYKPLQEKDSQSLFISKPNQTGEYKCTVKFDHNETQVYFFIVQFLGVHELEREKCTVIGVPSILNVIGREDYG